MINLFFESRARGFRFNQIFVYMKSWAFVPSTSKTLIFSFLVVKIEINCRIHHNYLRMVKLFLSIEH